jgi:Uma2 family endonuclease
MAMPAMELARHWTREEVLALPDDGNRYELVDGELLVSPAPRALHQVAVGELFVLIREYVERNGLGRTLLAPADLDLRSRQLLQPDLFVAATIEGRRPRTWDEVGIPLLVAEVLSPSTAEHDRETKRALFQRAGVPLYWIVNLEARVFECWTPGAARPAVTDVTVAWHPARAVPPLELDVRRYFDAVLAP